MSNENLGSQLDQQFTAAIPQVPAEQKPRKKRLRSLINHERHQYATAIRERNTKAFEQVLMTYVEVSSLSPLGAFSIDPTARRNGIAYVHIDWLVDVQNCAKSVLSSFLHGKWQSLISIESQELSEDQKRRALSAAGITPQIVHRLTQKLGLAFYCRELKPGRYFTKIKRRNRFEKVREPQITFSDASDPHASSVYRGR